MLPPPSGFELGSQWRFIFLFCGCDGGVPGILLAASSDRKYLVQDSFYLQNITFQKWVYIPGEFSSLFASALASIGEIGHVFLP